MIFHLRKIGRLFARAIAITTMGYSASTANGQGCQPYWAAVPTWELPGYSDSTTGQFGFFASSSEHGPGLYAIRRGTSVSPEDSYIRRFDGERWHLISMEGIPPDFYPGTLKSLDDGTGIKLYMRAARFVPGEGWEGQPFKQVNGRWQPLPKWFWMGQLVEPLTSADLGRGTRIYAHNSTYVFEWDGLFYNVVGTMNAGGSSLGHFAFFDPGNRPRLYTFGGLWNIGGSIGSFVEYDGSSWQFPGGAPQAALVNRNCSAVFDWSQGPRLVASGQFQMSTGGTYASLGVFDGTTWTTVGRPIPISPQTTLNGPVCVFNDGRGPAVFMTGSFPDINGIPTKNIARWDGHGWEAVPGGLNYGVNHTEENSMVVMNTRRGPTMIVVGQFIGGAAGGYSPRAVQYIGCPNCYADCDLNPGSPRLTANDFLCFLSTFTRKDPYANCDLNTTFDAADFQCFLNRFAAGCN
jgi:hypothetical protein